MLLDNLEYISIESQSTDFPKHFHETFCISLIHKGIEQIDFEHQSLFSEQGSISITNPYEIHSNPLMNKSSCLNFDTIYISSDLMKHLLGGKNIRFVNRKIKSKQANQLFIALTNAMDIKNPNLIEVSLQKFADSLYFHSQEYKEEFTEKDLEGFSKINNYIEENICDKFHLSELSKMANINKFGFIKKFKTSSGMTPMNYILMKKIFSCKKQINSSSEFTEIAYQYNFTDLAHFSKTFKRYIGISPKQYQASIIEFS